jgi:hypothetical protein
MGHLSRRAFLAACAAATFGAPPQALRGQERVRPREPKDDDRLPGRRLARVGELLRARFRDLPRHFIFEYYPWYGVDPWFHWDGAGRRPPAQIAASALPLLGAYDSRSARVIEQHARWIVESGVGAINLSWWGRGSYEDQSTHVIMDVMRAFDIKVAFHLEPYSRERGARFADDVMYILREYGERRRWDTMLLLEDANGRAAPVFKSFVTLLPATTTNCLGVTTPVDVFVPNDVWRQQTARIRSELASDFERVTLVADSLDAARTTATGFDASAVGNPYIRPDEWAGFVEPFDRAGMPFSFAVNAGFDNVEPTPRPADPCYEPMPFEPPLNVRWDIEASREQAHLLSAVRIRSSFERTLAHQTHPRSANWQRGFLLVPVNSFNEWHEGTSFEPMKSSRDLSASERALYHNPAKGSYRLEVLGELMHAIL